MELRPSETYRIDNCLSTMCSTPQDNIFFPQIFSLHGEEVPNSQKRNLQFYLQEETREEKSSIAQNPGINE